MITVFTNADFISFNEENTTYSVMVINGKEIAYVGYNIPLCYDDARVVDLGGKAVIPLVKTPSIIVAADTIVVLDGKVLGKPDGYDGAFEMLRSLSGRTHQVVTAIVVMNSETGVYKKKSTTSEVLFEKLSDEKIKYYIDNFKPFDKAGSYGIQEMPAGYIKSYSGDFENIIGMSSKTLLEMIGEGNTL